MPVKPKPKSIEFDLFEQRILDKIAISFNVGTVNAVSSLAIEGDSVILLSDKTQTSRKTFIMTSTGEYFLKQIPWYCDDTDLVDTRMEYIDYLYNSGIPIPRPIKQINGSFYVNIENEKFTLSELIEGQIYSRPKEHGPAAAQALAEIHKISQDYNSSRKFRENTLTILEDHIELAHGNNLVDEEVERVFHLIKNYSRTTFAGLDDLPYQPVHGNFCPWNLLFENDKVKAVYDFDNFCYDSRLHDIAEAIVTFYCLDYYGNSSRMKRGIFRDFPISDIAGFLDIYVKTNPLEEKEIALLPSFILSTLWECYLLSYARGHQSKEEVIMMLDFPSLVDNLWFEIYS